jgi:hypothetical protein
MFKRFVLLAILGVLVGLVWWRLASRPVAPGGRPGAPAIAASGVAAARGPAATRPATPRFVTPPIAEEINDRPAPGAPGYNPSKLAHLVPLRELFEREPRNASWAAVIEREVPALAAQDTERLLPGFKVTGMECHTTICRVSWRVDPGYELLTKKLLRIVIPGAVSHLEQNNDWHVALHGNIFAEVEMGNPEATLARLKEIRSSAMKSARAGRDDYFLQEDNIAADRWPAP